MATATEAPLIIAGSGRSGTTWILDVLAQSNNLRPIFEPLHPVGVPSARPFANHYVADDAEEPELRLFMDKVFQGKIGGLWLKSRELSTRLRPSKANFTSFRYNYHQLLRYKETWKRYREYRNIKSSRIIVKFIRANLMLGWLAKNYQARIVFVIRHPAAVISSKMSALDQYRRSDWDHKAIFQQLLKDHHLYRDFLHNYADIFKCELTEISAYAALWCIENSLPLTKAQESGRPVVFYEDLLMNQETEWRRVISALGLENMPSTTLLQKPSQQTYGPNKEQPIGKSQLTKWSYRLTRQELQQVDKVLNYFDINIYRAFEPLPATSLQDHTAGVKV